MTRYQTVYEAARRWHMQTDVLRERCVRGEIAGARQQGAIWLIPMSD